MTQFNLKNDESFNQIETHLSNNKFLSGTDFPNSTDAEIYFAIKSKPPSKDSFPSFSNWFQSISQFAETLLKLSLESKSSKNTEALPETEDVFNLFGDDEPSEKVDFKHYPKLKERTYAKSIIVFSVSVYEIEQDLDELARRIFDLKFEGLVWRTEYQLQEVGYGIKKLVIGCTIEDELVLVDDIFDKIQEWDEEVQACDIILFQKV